MQILSKLCDVGKSVHQYICILVTMDLHINFGFNVKARMDFCDQVTSLFSKVHHWPFETGLNGPRPFESNALIMLS